MFRLVAGRPVLAGMDLAAQAARETLTAAVGVVTDGTSLTGRIGRAVLDGLLEPRRPRVSTRKVKSPLSRWNKADPHRPACSTPVTALTITVSDPGTTTPPATRQQQCLTGTPGPYCNSPALVLALARIAIMQALRAADPPAAIAVLDEAVTLLAPALAEDERVDVAVAADIAILLRDLLTTGRIQDEAHVARLAANVADHRHLDSHRMHWIADRTAASHIAWSRLAIHLGTAHQRLAEPSWYSVPAAIDNIIDLYRTLRSSRAYRRGEDDTAVRDIIAPTLEAGFAVNAALLRHLQDHVDHLQRLVSQGLATGQQADDLPTAILMRNAATARLSADGPESARGPATTEIDPPPGPSGDRIAASVKAMRQATRLTTGSILADTLLERARHGFAASHDYDGDAQVAADFVTHLLVAFVFSRTGLGENEVPYLYDPEADEPMLARDLQDFVAASGQPPSFMGGLI